MKNAPNVFHHPSCTLVKLVVKLGTALLIGSGGKLSHVCPNATYSGTVLGWVCYCWAKIALCVAPHTWHLRGIQIWRVIRCSLFLCNHLRTVLLEPLLRDTCNAHRAPCILLNLPLHLATVCCTLQWTLEAEINKNNFNYCLQQHYHCEVIVM